MSVSLEGSLYVASDAEDQLLLFDEIVKSGHPIGLSETQFPERAPFLISRGAEIVGEEAIRRYFSTAE